jgi:hypothetical protein
MYLKIKQILLNLHPLRLEAFYYLIFLTNFIIS